MRKSILLSLFFFLFSSRLFAEGQGQTDVDIKIEAALQRQAVTRDQSAATKGLQGRSILFVEAQKALKSMAGVGFADLEPLTFTFSSMDAHRRRFIGISTLHTIHGVVCVDYQLKVEGDFNTELAAPPYYVDSVQLVAFNDQQCV